MRLSVGQVAPDFNLSAVGGRTIRLSEMRGQNVILAFFPQAWTPI